MRTYPAVILSSLALVAALESAAAAAASTSSPTQSKAKLDSGHEHRVRTSGRALRVQETVDEDEDKLEDEDERGWGVRAIMEKLVGGKPKLSEEEASVSRRSGVKGSTTNKLNSKEAWEYFDELFLVPENPDLLQKIRIIKGGLEKKRQVMEVLAKSNPDLLLGKLAGRYDEVSLLLALVAEAEDKNAPKFVKALKAKQMKRLVKTKITPKNLVKELEFVRKNVRANVGENVAVNVEENAGENFGVNVGEIVEEENVEENVLESVRENENERIPYTFECLAQFIKAYNKGKKTSERVTVLQALRASGTWESNETLLEYLKSRRYSSHVANDAYRKLDAELKAKRSGRR